MQDTLISLETAKLAKEKGFDLECRYYFKDGLTQDSFDLSATPDNYNSDYWKSTTSDDIWISQPTQSLLQKWLRDKKYDIAIIPVTMVGNVMNYKGYITHPSMVWDKVEYVEENTYEEVLEKCLIKALELL